MARPTQYPQLDLLPLHAIEESTYIINLTFTDEDGGSVTTKGRVVWQLLSLISGSLSTIATGSTAATASADIVLSGSDLDLFTGENNYGLRLFDVATTYDSSLGSDLPLRDGVRFLVDNLGSI